MQPRKIANANVMNVSGTLETNRDGDLLRVLRIETDLILDPTQPGYDEQAEAALVEAVTEAMGDLFDRADYVTVPRP